MIARKKCPGVVAVAWWAVVVGVFLLFLLVTPAALAQQPPADPNTCALCHQAEVQDWKNSPHAGAAKAVEMIDGHEATPCQNASDPTCNCLECHTTSFDAATPAPVMGVTCEACHGPLAPGHPEEAEMQLNVDSSVCSSCHVETHSEWQATAHGQAGVQCIGCHRSHTQNLRLEDEALCESCHRDRLLDGGHALHLESQVNCIDCHTSPSQTVSNVEGVMPSPSHEFSVNTAACQTCHSELFLEGNVGIALSEEQMETSPLTTTQAAAQAATVAEPTEQADRRWLQGATLVTFGMGMGIGGMIGIAFVLIAGFVLQRVGRS
jgi:hypothetical protein